MGQALYRKYRSKSLEEIIGQEHITSTLQQALKQGRISHAYLFTGPRGVGKTSIARILAHAINDLPYTDDSSHLDIIEIDAASNRRIDEIRELRDKVYVAPTSAKYKVYIIDEVHMLTKEAFNALLKTLEEPPAHVVFILATTDAQKLPETIVSRTQRFSFKPVPNEQVVAHLRHIATEEKLQITDDALQLLAEFGEGSFRDSINLLDQATSHGRQVTADDIRELLGAPPRAAIEALLAQIDDGGTIAAAAKALSALYDQGYQATAIAVQLAQLIRQDLVGPQRFDPQTSLQLLSDLLSVSTAHDSECYLEIVLLQRLQSAKPEPAESVRPAISAAVPLPPVPKTSAKTPLQDLPSVATPPPKSEVKPATPRPKAEHRATVGPQPDTQDSVTKPAGQPFDETLWPAVLADLKQHHNTLYGVVRMAQPQFDDQELTLSFGFAFHQKRVNEARNQQVIADSLRQLTGQSIAINCIVDKAAKPVLVAVEPLPTTPVITHATDGLSTISNIFGGAELLES